MNGCKSFHQGEPGQLLGQSENETQNKKMVWGQSLSNAGGRAGAENEKKKEKENDLPPYGVKISAS